MYDGVTIEPGSTIAQSRLRILPFLIVGWFLAAAAAFLLYASIRMNVYSEGVGLLIEDGAVALGCIALCAAFTSKFILTSTITIENDGFSLRTWRRAFFWKWDEVTNFRASFIAGPTSVLLFDVVRGGLNRRAWLGSFWPGGLHRTAAWLESARRQYAAKPSRG